MKARAKPPSLVSMWMLDVFCCALGCVTLLWLLNSQNAIEQAEVLAKRQDELEQTKLAFENSTRSAEGRIALLEGEKRDLRTKLDQLDARYLLRVEELKKYLALTQALQADLTKKELALADLRKELTDKSKALDAAAKEAAQRTRDLEQAIVKLEQTSALLADEKKSSTLAVAKLKEWNAKYQDLEGKYLALSKDSTTTRATVEDLLKEKLRLSAVVQSRDEEIARLRQTMESARANIIALSGNNKKLADRIDELNRRVDNTFAGVTLSGKRVVFLVDISGSMAEREFNVPDPQKWPGVIDTLARIMRSLPALTQYQVILFSSGTEYPFGSRREWLTFDGEKSIETVRTTLSARKPEGGTNLWRALEEGFRYRDAGLDTIYLLSDGLPSLVPTGPDPEKDVTLSASGLTVEKLSRTIRDKVRLEWNPPQSGRARVTVNTIGFFYESPDLGAFLWALARENEGAFVGMSKP